MKMETIDITAKKNRKGLIKTNMISIKEKCLGKKE